MWRHDLFLEFFFHSLPFCICVCSCVFPKTTDAATVPSAEVGTCGCGIGHPQTVLLLLAMICFILHVDINQPFKFFLLHPPNLILSLFFLISSFPMRIGSDISARGHMCSGKSTEITDSLKSYLFFLNIPLSCEEKKSSNYSFQVLHFSLFI